MKNSGTPINSYCHGTYTILYVCKEALIKTVPHINSLHILALLYMLRIKVVLIKYFSAFPDMGYLIAYSDKNVSRVKVNN